MKSSMKMKSRVSGIFLRCYFLSMFYSERQSVNSVCVLKRLQQAAASAACVFYGFLFLFFFVVAGLMSAGRSLD